MLFFRVSFGKWVNDDILEKDGWFFWDYLRIKSHLIILLHCYKTQKDRKIGVVSSEFYQFYVI